MAKVTITLEDKDGEMEVEMSSEPHFNLKDLTIAQKFGVRTLEFVKTFSSIYGGRTHSQSVTTPDGKEHEL